MENKIRLDITVEEILFLFMWAAFFLPPVLSRVSSLLSHGATLLGYGAFLLMLLRKRKDFPLSNDLLYIFIFLFYCSIIILFKTPIEAAGFARRSLLPVIESVFLIRWSLGGQKRGFKVLYHVCAIYIVINFFSIILFPMGFFRSSEGSSIERAQWILGSKNNIPLYIVMMISIAAYYYYTIQKTKMFYVLVVMGAVSIMISGDSKVILMGGSSTGMLAYASTLLMIAYYLYVRRINKPAFGVKGIFILILILNFFILSGQNIPGMKDLIMTVFQKDLTFSGRTDIWSTNLDAVREHLFIGHGEESIVSRLLILRQWITTDYTYNLVVKLLLNYGLVGLGLFIIMIMKTKRGHETGDRILYSGFLGLLIIGLMNEIDFKWLLFFPLMLTLYPQPMPVMSFSSKRRIKPERSLGLQIRF